MPLSVQLTEQVLQIQQQFADLSPSKDAEDAALATDLFQQFEQTLLRLITQEQPTAELGRYVQHQLNWMSQQVEQVNTEKMLITEQILQITRARKGNASYDEHKSG